MESYFNIRYEFDKKAVHESIDRQLKKNDAGTQKQLREAGLWYATASEEDLIQLMQQEPGLLHDWDDKYGDRMQKIVFIGQHLDKEAIARELDACLE